VAISSRKTTFSKTVFLEKT